MLNIINHSVKINDIGLLQFMYPNYKIVSAPIPVSENPIIYVGDTKHVNFIKNLGVNYIIVSTLGEYDLNDRKTLLEISFSKWNKPVPKYLLSFYEDLEDNEFMKCWKYHWITGKWSIKSHDNTGAFLEFLYSFKTDTYRMMKTYLELLDKVGAEYIELSLLTFLNRVVNTSGNVSKWYRMTINDYKSSKYYLIEPAINKYMSTKIYNSELRIFNLILNLNRRT